MQKTSYSAWFESTPGCPCLTPQNAPDKNPETQTARPKTTIFEYSRQIRTLNEGWLQGFITMTTFTVWQRNFRWDSMAPENGIVLAEMEGKAWDKDNILGRELERQPRSGKATCTNNSCIAVHKSSRSSFHLYIDNIYPGDPCTIVLDRARNIESAQRAKQLCDQSLSLGILD